MDQSDEKDLSEILAAIRKMVRSETRANVSEAVFSDTKPDPEPAKSEPKLPSKILILRPHMRVYPDRPHTIILDDDMRVPHDTPIPANDSFAIADTAIDDHLLRDMVREVVQEQLRGELGKEIVGALKRDMALLLEKNR